MCDKEQQTQWRSRRPRPLHRLPLKNAAPERNDQFAMLTERIMNNNVQMKSINTVRAPHKDRDQRTPSSGAMRSGTIHQLGFSFPFLWSEDGNTEGGGPHILPAGVGGAEGGQGRCTYTSLLSPPSSSSSSEFVTNTLADQRLFTPIRAGRLRLGGL